MKNRSISRLSAHRAVFCFGLFGFLFPYADAAAKQLRIRKTRFPLERFDRAYGKQCGINSAEHADIACEFIPAEIYANVQRFAFKGRNITFCVFQTCGCFNHTLVFDAFSIFYSKTALFISARFSCFYR